MVFYTYFYHFPVNSGCLISKIWLGSDSMIFKFSRKKNIRKFLYFLLVVIIQNAHYWVSYYFWLFLVIQTLGEQLKLRQQVIATATVYFKRFYARNSLKCIDPLLLAPTCIFLASKVEEFGVISNSRLITTCQTVGKHYFCNQSKKKAFSLIC